MSIFTPKDSFDYLSRLQDQVDQGKNPIQDLMDGSRRAALGGSEETRRQFIDNKPDGTVFYRKMGQGEWNAGTNNGKRRYNFEAPFSYNNTKNYRLWMSSSLDKVRIFGNEDCSTSDDLIVMFIFDADLSKKFTIQGHQEKGVQNTPDVVAMHREGFPDISLGQRIVRPTMNTDGDVTIVLEQKKAYNLGFTSMQMSKLNSYLSRADLVDY